MFDWIDKRLICRSLFFSEHADDGLLIRRQIREKRSLDTSLLSLLQFDSIIPPHSLYEVGGWGDKRCPVVSDKIVTSLAKVRMNRARKGEHLTSIATCNTASDKPPPFAADSMRIVASAQPATIRLRCTKLRAIGCVRVAYSVSSPPWCIIFWAVSLCPRG